MEQVLISIDNKDLEQRLKEEADKRGRNLANMIVEILEKTFLPGKSPKLKYKNLDPLKHMSGIEYDLDEDVVAADEDLSDVFPFKDVKDSAAYVRELRKNAWRS